MTGRRGTAELPQWRDAARLRRIDVRAHAQTVAVAPQLLPVEIAKLFFPETVGLHQLHRPRGQNPLTVYAQSHACQCRRKFGVVAAGRELLIDRNMKKKELAERAGLSLATITKMGKDGTTVTSDVLVKICVALNCQVGDIMEIVPDDNTKQNEVTE